MRETYYKKPEHNTWQGMYQRCYNKKHPGFRHYGGRGISICPEWLGKGGFLRFYADMGDKPGPEYSIDRIDNNGNYSKENCRWATQNEQCRNRRVGVYVTWNGKTQRITEWAKEVGISEVCIASRLRMGWDVERALTHSHAECRGTHPRTFSYAYQSV